MFLPTDRIDYDKAVNYFSRDILDPKHFHVYAVSLFIYLVINSL